MDAANPLGSRQEIRMSGKGFVAVGYVEHLSLGERVAHTLRDRARLLSHLEPPCGSAHFRHQRALYTRPPGLPCAISHGRRQSVRQPPLRILRRPAEAGRLYRWRCSMT